MSDFFNLREFVANFDHGIVIYYLALNFFYLILLGLSLVELISRRLEAKIEKEELVDDHNFIPISILSPAFNEAPTIVSSVRAMLSLDYPSFELIVINDGSTDETLKIRVDTFKLYPLPASVRLSIKTQQVIQYYRSMVEPKLIVVDKQNGGKSDALNAGINAAQTPLFLACDADTLLEKTALRSLASAFLTSSNMAACGGTIRVVNSCTVEKGVIKAVRFPREVLPALQAIEYLRAFFLGRLGWNRLGGNLVVSGALGLFDRDMVMAVGGYAVNTVGEDMELIVRLHRHFYELGTPKQVRFIVEPLAWTEVPVTASQLGRQRERWHRGLLQSLWLHRKMFFNPKFKMTGLIGYPFFVLGEMLAPVVEGFGLIGIVVGIYLDSIDLGFIWMFFLAAWGLNILMNLVAILVEQLTYKRYHGVGNLGRMVFYAFFENVGYRQLTVFWRLKSFWYWAKGSLSWGALNRKGFES
jgi:cellulose synthase/poly-beta-1,6-N-acetylglucosamine synthase-like glycosyltransferase